MITLATKRRWSLKLCYQCIRQAFPSEQNCFRIGGDEFAYIFHKDEKELIADKIHKLELLLNEKDQDLSYSLSVSSGYAYYQPDTDMDFKDIVRRSDTMLYREKRRKNITFRFFSSDAFFRKAISCTRDHGWTDHAGEKYQHISPTELCGIIDLLSQVPMTICTLLISGPTFTILRHSHWNVSAFLKMLL